MNQIEKKIESIKNPANWDHDIKYIDGRFVEDAVSDYQTSKDEDLLMKIVGNYNIFRGTWGRIFAQYCDGDIEAGETLHDETIWRSIVRFDPLRAQKTKGKAFNAFLVSALLNLLKNLRNAKMSHKNHPRVNCPICKEEVYQIDSKHLRHVIDFDRYKKMFPSYPLSALDGKISCPITGELIDEITEPYLNRVKGYYTVEDFNEEFSSLLPRFPFRCPITGIELKHSSPDYPKMIMKGYTVAQFVNDFPKHPAIIHCPFTGNGVLEITQDYLDRVLHQNSSKERYTMAKFLREYPNATVRAKRAKVNNPFGKGESFEISPELLFKNNTTIKDHLEDNASIVLEKRYPMLVVCPFTGRKTHQLTREDLGFLGKTTFDFYHAVCKFPIRRWQVKCASCGEWVDNIWGHLEKVTHNYSDSMDLEDFETRYGSGATKVVVSTNSFYNNDSGDSVHIADLLGKFVKSMSGMEIEDSIIKVAKDEFDKRIAKAMATAQTLGDICEIAGEKRAVSVPEGIAPGKTKGMKEAIRKSTELDDFDVIRYPIPGTKKAEIMIPSENTVRICVERLIRESDLIDP